MNQMIEDLKRLLAQPQKIGIVSHRNPDGDAVGSSMALYHVLKQLGHEVKVIFPNQYPEFLAWIPGVENSLIYEENIENGKKTLQNIDLLFVLDFNAFHRVGGIMEPVLSHFKKQVVVIDHHQQPEIENALMFSDTNQSSTCQYVYEVLEKAQYADAIDAISATCLYTGIMTDTGSFRFPSTTSKTHQIVSKLIDKGVDNAHVHEEIFGTNRLSRLQLLGVALNNLVFLEELSTAYITLTHKELRDNNFKKGDTEGFVNYALSLKNINLAAIFIEDEEQGIVKISFRSKGNFSVNEFARKYFEGGGHKNAAGGRSTASLLDTVKKFEKLLPQYDQSIVEAYATS